MSDILYYNASLDILGIRFCNDWGDYILINHDPTEYSCFSDVIIFDSASDDWEYVCVL